jgi:hypothetical protein
MTAARENGGMLRWGWVLVLGAALVLGACSSDGGGDTSMPTSRASTTIASTTPLVTTPNGEPRREGDYETVASGNDDGLDWTVDRAPAAGGGACWRVTTDPELDFVFADEHCVTPVAGPSWFTVDFPQVARLKPDHDIVVLSSPAPIKQATFAFADGTDAEAVFMSDDGTVAVWAGAADPVALSVALTLDDGTEAACGPGDVQSADQMRGKSDKQIREIREFPWTCTEVLTTEPSSSTPS